MCDSSGDSGGCRQRRSSDRRFSTRSVTENCKNWVKTITLGNQTNQSYLRMMLEVFSYIIVELKPVYYS